MAPGDLICPGRLVHRPPVHREIVLYAAKQLPKIFASIFTLIAMCGGLGFALHEAAGTDPLTAYLATSPGGADAVAIIAASSPVDVPSSWRCRSDVS